MAGESGENKERDSEAGPTPNDLEIEQATLAADFNTKVIRAHLALVQQEDRERDELRSALHKAPIIQSLESKLASSNADIVSAQQSQEEHDALMAELNGGK